jgi:hypothetical protein
LLTAIQASHNREEWVSNSKSANRGKRELKDCPAPSIMFLQVSVLAEAELRGGVSRFCYEA